MTRAFDYETMPLEGLKNLLTNARRLGREDVALDVLKELTRRGAAKNRDFAALRWNQQAANDALTPFVQVSKGVPANQRTIFTDAGGRKIGRPKDDPERMWVDTYTAIKTPKVNAVFVCYIPRPGDEAYFELHLSGETVERYSPDQLETGLSRWTEIAHEAV